jgi:hypothetical protein
VIKTSTKGTLYNLISKIAKLGETATEKEIQQIFRKYPKQASGLYRKSDILEELNNNPDRFTEEQSKRSDYLSFINSDPEMVICMYQWMQKYLKVDKKSIKIRLFMHSVFEKDELMKK